MALINKNSIKTMMPSDILEIINGDMQRIKKNYIYLAGNINLDNLILNEVSKSINEYDGSVTYKAYIEKKIKSSLIAYVIANNEDKELMRNIVNDYINNNFFDSDSYDEVIKKINKLFRFIKSVNYNYDILLFIDLMKNNLHLYKAVDLLYLNNSKRILNGEVEKIFHSTDIMSLIEVYCDMNNYTIDDSSSITDTGFLAPAESMYLNEIGKVPLLTPEHERLLLEKYAAGDESAKNKLIESNLRLVVNIAKNYVGRGVPFLDLIQEGNLGLIKSIEKFDLTVGNRLTTYATWWIRQSIMRSIYNIGNVIRKPVHMEEKLRGYFLVLENLRKKLDREPTENEIANEMGISIKKVREYYILSFDTISLEQTVSDESDTELGAFVARSTDNVENTVEQRVLSQEIFNIFDRMKLKEKERDIIIKRFGLDGNDPRTLQEIAIEYDVTRERIRQIEKKVIKRLRNSTDIKQFAIYMDDPDKALKRLVLLQKNDIKEIDIEEDDNMANKSTSIYEYFNEYTKEQIDLVIQSLNENEIALIKKKHGEKLDGVGRQGLTVEENSKYFGNVVRKIKTRLAKVEKIKVEPLVEQVPVKVYQVPAEANARPKDKTNQANIASKTNPADNTSKVALTEEKNSSKQAVEVIDATKKINEPVLVSTLDMQEKPATDFTNLQNLFKFMPVKEATVVSLTMGFVNGKKYSVSEIARFLNIPTEEAKLIVSECLTVWKDTIVALLDKEIQRVLK